MIKKSVYTTGASSTNNPEGMTRGGFATNFGSGVAGTGVRGVEGTIVGCIFKALVSRLASSKEELATPENEVSFQYCQPFRYIYTHVLTGSHAYK